MYSWKGESNVAPNLIFNIEIMDRDGVPSYSIRRSYGRCTGIPPIEDNNLRVD
jgi:hypothetical protein